MFSNIYSFYQVSSGYSHQASDSSRTIRWSSGSTLSRQDMPTSYLDTQLKSEQTHDQRLFLTIIFANTSYQLTVYRHWLQQRSSSAEAVVSHRTYRLHVPGHILCRRDNSGYDRCSTWPAKD